jgi:hypothetical protein
VAARTAPLLATKYVRWSHEQLPTICFKAPILACLALNDYAINSYMSCTSPATSTSLVVVLGQTVPWNAICNGCFSPTRRTHDPELLYMHKDFPSVLPNAKDRILVSLECTIVRYIKTRMLLRLCASAPCQIPSRIHRCPRHLRHPPRQALSAAILACRTDPGQTGTLGAGSDALREFA